ncbi:hypothetical protein [Jannaschia sp. CCS1]|uniref:hypothetical protein n=1 Tax=Jannaschia sp. (strain CCS1) TaxID=290400 RepID=UPI0005C73E1C|nr:hypothetical protein [Jannaschia sp. CCS1]
MRTSVSALALGVGVAVAVSGLAMPAAAQSCAGDARLIDGVCLPAISAPGPRIENVPTGFVISLDGEVFEGDDEVRDLVRRTDVRLANADIEVVFDGLGAIPRLDLEVAGDPRAYEAGDTATLQSATNYPAYITRGELRIVDLAAIGGQRTLQVVPILPNGTAQVEVPEGSRIAVIHRVYDAQGRYDETFPVLLSEPDRRPLASDVEDGSDLTARSRIPVHGGAVTVRGTSIVEGAAVTALGERVQSDGSGGFVLQRILPPGEYGVDVQVAGPGQHVDLVRDIEIPRSEWFTTGMVDLTVGWREIEGEETEQWDSGRVAFYVDGRTANGFEITAQADTGEGDIEDIFRRLEERDPRSTVQRIDPDDLYPTYGDDSTLVDDTPTSGRLYVRIERDGNHVLWGDFDAGLDGARLVRNDRSLYGAQGYWATADTTLRGEARASVLAYAASPDMLAQRDVFLGTGGSVYVLQRQDIGVATEVLSVEVRDPVSGRVIDIVRLTPGEDYEINYLQGIVTLSAPLASRVSSSGIVSTPGDDPQLRLVAQYEYTPTVTDVDGYSVGGRAEAWVTDDVRVGVSGLVEETGTADQTVMGADIEWRIGENSHVRLEYAESEGPGFGSTFSADGGLIFDTVGPNGGSGTAIRGDARLDFADIGLAGDGVMGAYYEEREEGFSSLDYSVTSATGNETLWGVFIDATPREGLRYSLTYDDYSNTAGEYDRRGEGAVELALNAAYTLGLGLEHTDRDRAASFGETGQRTDVGARLTYSYGEDRDVYIFGQATVAHEGLERNDRLGVGANYAFADGWSVQGEVSGGSRGPGGLLQLGYDDGEGTTAYIGYELDPGRTISGVTLDGRDNGRLIAGARRQVNDQLTYFGENTYDMFGRYNSLSTAYGLTYQTTEFLSYTAALEFGSVDDSFANDFDRSAISLGVRYEDEALTAAARLEYRIEEGERSGAPLDSETVALTLDGRYIIDDHSRFVFSFEGIDTDTDESSILDGSFVDASVGYAFRPTDNDRLNMLVRYRYLFDDVGQRLNGTDELGPRQRTHVFSADSSYLLNDQLRIGARVGFRLTEAAATETDSFTDNDAYIAVLNARYHMLHNWDALLEWRALRAEQAGFTETSVLGAISRQIGNGVSLGVGYNFGSFSDDLTDLTRDDQGLFLNLTASF